MVATHRTSHRTLRAVVAVALAGSLIAASCSGDSNSSDTTTPATIALATTTPKAVDTISTTADTTSSTATTDDATSTTIAAVATYPLTGLPLLDPVAATRPALVVKIDNNPAARPQSGVNEADIVYEENVEQLTRFAAIFHSNGADPVGPIRSGRTQDVDLLGSLNKPLFAWSGGNARVSAAIAASDLVQINETKAGQAMFRSKNRKAPHNLYANVSALYRFASADAAAPQPQFQYRPDGSAPAGAVAEGVKVSMDGIKVHWQWDAASSTYLRFSDDKVHEDAINGVQVATSNVIVLEVEYQPSPADGRSPEAQTIGTGVVVVFSGGKVVAGIWTRADRLAAFTLTDADGAPIRLTPGHTFIELARTGKTAIVPAGTDAKSVRYP